MDFKFVSFEIDVEDKDAKGQQFLSRLQKLDRCLNPLHQDV